MEIVTQILKTIPIMIFILFLGPWSDKAGRKVLIMLPFAGYALDCLILIVNVYFFDQLVVEFMWLESISSCFGGFTLLNLGAYGYIADTSSLKSRTIRIAVIDSMSSVSGTIGHYINGYLYAELGYYGSFGFALACFLLGLVIVCFTVQNKRDSNSKKTKTNLLDFKNVFESFKVLSKPRAENMRHIVIILVICFQIGIFSGGTFHINYLYVRKTFHWTDENTLVRLEPGSMKIIERFSDQVLFSAGFLQIRNQYYQSFSHSSSSCEGFQTS